MLRLPALCCCSLLAILSSAVLPAKAAASSQSAATGQPIDPDNFYESLLAAAIFQETNRQRVDRGLPAFLPEEKASEAARLHARWMARTHRLSHDEPSGRGTPTTSFDRLVQQGLRPHIAAENVAYNLVPNITPGRLFYTRLVEDRKVYSYQPEGPPLRAHTYEDFARVMLAQWMRSPPHRAHIVDPEIRFLGAGAAVAHRRGHPDTIYVAQEFFTPHEESEGPAIHTTRSTLVPRRP